MNTEQAKSLIGLLKSQGVKFEHGLTDNEISQVEQNFHIQFPPDLKLLLQTGLPIDDYSEEYYKENADDLNFIPSGYGFVNWRLSLYSKTESQIVQERLDNVLIGILFDIENNDFWWHEWGDRPNDLQECLNIAKKYYQKYPKMIPIYLHRYTPSSPNQSDNPVFSIHQTDIIYYDNDLASYLAHEFSFELPKAFKTPSNPKRVVFWSDLIDYLDTPIDENSP